MYILVGIGLIAVCIFAAYLVQNSPTCATCGDPIERTPGGGWRHKPDFTPGDGHPAIKELQEQ